MLEEIRIRDLGVIEEAHLELGPGLTVLTGETGAGKTMVLTALAMVLGGKVDGALVRDGAERAVSAATFAAARALSERAAEEFGADVDDGLVLARMLTAEGRSRALLGGASVPAGVLAEFGEALVSIHGQGSTSNLLRPSAQRELLDAYGGEALLALRESHRREHARLRELDGVIAELTASRDTADSEAAELRELISHYEKVRPLAGEISALHKEIERLGHLDGLITAAGGAREALVGDGDEASAASLVAAARRAIESQATLDARLEPILAEVVEVLVRLEELGHDLARYIDGEELDPRRLEQAHARLATLQALCRRLDLPSNDEGIETLTARYAAAGLRLIDLDRGDERLAEIESQRSACLVERDRIADLLTAARTAAAAQLAASVTAEIQALAMPHTTFAVDVRAGSHGPSGRDEVEFLLAGGGAAVPVAKGASGGELSRVMLGLEVIMASAQSVPTYIFDEVDAGVGGAAAIEVGRRLQRLAEHAQVVVVTHLAQVAAFADAHFTVTKDSRGRVSSSTIRRLEDAERAAELARMMAGLSESERAQASAAELLEFARGGRAGR